MPDSLRRWLSPPRPADPPVVTDPAERRLIKVELIVVFAITLGLSAASSLLSFANALVKSQALSEQSVTMHESKTDVAVIDFLAQLLSVLRLVGWAALGAYLLVRAGIGLKRVGLSRLRGRDAAGGLALAALIGLPGLAFYFAAVHLGLNLQVVPSTLDESWWRPVTLTLSAVANSAAEEVLVVGYLLTRLRQLGLTENASLLVSALLRGSYHLYQGIGGFLGNVVMGLVFGRVWQRTSRLWPLLIAHAVLDVVAFVGYTLLSGSVSWLP